MSIRIDINLRWLAPITILQACHELAHVITARGLKVPSLSFAVDEHGPYHQARSIDELYQSHPLITTGGGVIHDSTGADWATFSVDTPCEPTKAGFTVKIRVRISRQLTAGQYLPTEIMDFAQLALKLTSADVVYGLNVGKYKGCFDHPTPSNREVLFGYRASGSSNFPKYRPAKRPQATIRITTVL